VTYPSGQRALRTTAAANSELPARATLRIPLHHGHLALKAGAALVVLLGCCGVLVLKGMGKLSPELPWQLASTGIALAAAVYAMLKAIARLQDGDPGLIVAPDGLTIRTENPGRRMGRIPWRAIAGFTTRRHKGHVHIEVQLRDPARCLADDGRPFGSMLHRLRAHVGGGKVVITPFWLRIENAKLEALLAGYLARYAHGA
jgi:hypothetical protein